MGGRICEYDAALCGYFGFGNLGDELLLASAIQNLVQCGVSRERICVFSNTPEDSQKKFSIRAFNRWSIKTVRAVLRRSRTLLFSGGGLFQDSTSVKSCLYYWGLLRLARVCGCRAWALGQSVGPLGTMAARRLTKDAMRRMDFLAVRDRASRDVLKNFGLDARMMPDLVFGLQIPDAAPNEPGSLASPLASPFLVNIRPGARHPESLCAMLAAIRAMAASGRELRGLAMSPEDAGLFAQCRERGEIPAFEVKTPRSIEEFADAGRGCAAAIGMRLHFAVLSMLCGLPVLVSAYDPKVASFAEHFSIPNLPDSDCPELSGNIMKTLTKTRAHDKRSQRQQNGEVSRFFEEGLSCVMGKGLK